MVMRKEENEVKIVMPHLVSVLSLQTVFVSLTGMLQRSSFSNVKGVELDSTQVLRVTLGDSEDLPADIPSNIVEEETEVRFPMNALSVPAFIEEIHRFTRAMRNKYPHSKLSRPLSYSFDNGVLSLREIQLILWRK